MNSKWICLKMASHSNSSFSHKSFKMILEASGMLTANAKLNVFARYYVAMRYVNLILCAFKLEVRLSHI